MDKLKDLKERIFPENQERVDRDIQNWQKKYNIQLSQEALEGLEVILLSYCDDLEYCEAYFS